MKSLQKLGGLAAIIEGASLLAMLVVFIAILGPAGLTEPSDFNDPTKFFSAMQANSGAWLYLSFIRGVIISPFFWLTIIALHQRLKSYAQDGMRVATFFGVAGAIFYMFGHLVDVTWINSLISSTDTARAAAELPIAHRLWQIGISGGGFFVGLWVLCLSTIIIRSSLLPKWVGYVGIIAGLLSIPNLVTMVKPSLPIFGIFDILIGWALWNAKPLHTISND